MRLFFESLILSIVVFIILTIANETVLYSIVVSINFFILYLILRHFFEKYKDKIIDYFIK